MATSTTSPAPAAYINGNVFTVDQTNLRAEAFLVAADGTFSAVGTTEQMSAIAKADHIALHDLNGQFVMPGLHDAHVHMLLSGIALTGHARLPSQGITSDNVAEHLKQGKCLCKYAHVHDDWVVGDTYLVENFKKEALDVEFPTTPAMIRGGAGHSAFLNSEALRRSGYALDEADGQGTKYMRDEHGQLTGEMAEMSLSKVMTTIPQPGLALVKTILLEAQGMLHKAGVTSCQEASSNSLLLRALHEMDAEGTLKLEMFPHIVYAPDWIGEETTASLHALLDQSEAYKSQHVNTGFLKLILDGVPLAPYFSHAALTSSGDVEKDKLFITNVHEAVQTYDAKGMTMKIHCTGQGATRLTLDAFAAVRKSNPNGPKHEIAHCSGVHDDEYPRFRELNVTAEMSPGFFFTHPITAASDGLMDWNFRKMRQSGANMTIGSDWGAGKTPDLLPFLSGIIDAIGGAEELCRVLTLGGAAAVGKEKELGSIEVGKKANFITVSSDLSKGEFEGAKVLGTWFEGARVFG